MISTNKKIISSKQKMLPLRLFESNSKIIYFITLVAICSSCLLPSVRSEYINDDCLENEMACNLLTESCEEYYSTLLQENVGRCVPREYDQNEEGIFQPAYDDTDYDTDDATATILKKVSRSESEQHSSPTDSDQPIRIHKYNLLNPPSYNYDDADGDRNNDDDNSLGMSKRGNDNQEEHSEWNPSENPLLWIPIAYKRDENSQLTDNDYDLQPEEKELLNEIESDETNQDEDELISEPSNILEKDAIIENEKNFPIIDNLDYSSTLEDIPEDDETDYDYINFEDYQTPENRNEQITYDEPIVIKADGLDQNGNPFHEEEVLITGNAGNNGQFSKMSRSFSSESGLHHDYFYPLTNQPNPFLNLNREIQEANEFFDAKIKRMNPILMSLMQQQHQFIPPYIQQLERQQQQEQQQQDYQLEQPTVEADPVRQFEQQILEKQLVQDINDQIKSKEQAQLQLDEDLQQALDTQRLDKLIQEQKIEEQLQEQKIAQLREQLDIRQEEPTELRQLFQQSKQQQVKKSRPEELEQNLSNFEMITKQSEKQFLNELNDKNSEKLMLENQQSENQQPQVQHSYKSQLTVKFDRKFSREVALDLVKYIYEFAELSHNAYKKIEINEDKRLIVLKLDEAKSSTQLANRIKSYESKIYEEFGLKITECTQYDEKLDIISQPLRLINSKSKYFFVLTVVICVSALCILLTLLCVFIVRRRSHLRSRLVGDISSAKLKNGDEERLFYGSGAKKQPWLFSLFKQPLNKMKTTDLSNEQPNTQKYQDLCRQHMQNTPMQKSANDSGLIMNSPQNNVSSNTSMNSTPIRGDMKNESPRSSASSWSEEPINSANMDITTGHVILSYMEEHLNDKNRLSKEWNELTEYQADQNKTEDGNISPNMTKNRYTDVLPFDHNRVKLIDSKIDNNYINASYIMDDDPKNPAYIATQGPLMHTSPDFWQMVWEQGSVVIVSLCRTVEYGSLKCNQFWPNGSEVFGNFEVHLVSKHVWCEDYLVRSFYLKNLDTDQTRTLTQFHFLTWPENDLPQNTKSILDFRRKVNKSFKSKCPIVVHCNDGVGRTGTYILIDMILNKITKGAKEIDLAATLEYLRDQRPAMIKNKNQFEFAFEVVTEELQNILKALTQQ